MTRSARGKSGGGVLASQMPESGFPSGVGVASTATALSLTVLACLSVLLLGAPADGSVPKAVTESQRHLVEGVGQTLGANIGHNADDLRVAVAVPSLGPDDLLARLAKVRKWRGAAVLDGQSRTMIAAMGEPVPIEVLPPSVSDAAVAPISDADGNLRVVTAIALPAGRLLVATSRARLPRVDLRQGLVVVTKTGQVVESRGPVPEQAMPLVAQAGAAATAGGHGTVYGESGAAASYAPVAAPGLGPLGLAVVAVAQVPTGAAATGAVGVLPAITLAVVALLGFLLIRRSLVTPVLRLRADALRVADGDLGKPVRVPRTLDSQRIALAFEHCRTTMSGESAQRGRPRRGLSARGAVIIATVGVLGWSACMALLATRHEVTVEESVVTALRDQTASTGETLRHSLGGGLADLKAVATLTRGADTAALRPVLDQLHANQSRYRSVYLVDKDGRAQHVAGREPLRAAGPPPPKAGVHQDGGSRVAVLYAHVPLADGAAVIGEFDVDRLAELLRSAPGKVRLLDADLRTLAATDGYVAFEKVSSNRLRRGVEAARHSGTAHVLDGSAVVVATVLRGGEATGAGWSVVAENPVGELALADNTLRRNAFVVSLIGVLLAMLLFGWHHFVLVRPLRALAKRADRLVAGDLDTVLYPQRHDQIGTLVSCLEICRQGVVDGIDRLGEVRRPRGTAMETTVLITRIDSTPVRRREALRR